MLVSALLALSLIDLDTFLLPNKIVYPLAVALVVLFGLAAVLDDAGDDYVRALLGGLAAFAFFLTVHLIAPRGMGFGDVKLSFSLGVALGWISWGSVFLGLFLGFLLGAVIGVRAHRDQGAEPTRPRARSVRSSPRGPCSRSSSGSRCSTSIVGDAEHVVLARNFLRASLNIVALC